MCMGDASDGEAELEKRSGLRDRFADNPRQVALLLPPPTATRSHLAWRTDMRLRSRSSHAGRQPVGLDERKRFLHFKDAPHHHHHHHHPHHHLAISASRHLTACGPADFSPTRMCAGLWIISGYETAFRYITNVHHDRVKEVTLKETRWSFFLFFISQTVSLFYFRPTPSHNLQSSQWP